MKTIKDNMVIFFNAFAALIVYGAWASYANFEHGAQAWIMAGSVQAVYAFFSTFFITKSAQFMYKKTGCGFSGVVYGFVSSFFIMFTIPLSIHSYVGTPDLIETILPGLIWGALYIVFFLALMEKKRLKRL